jgi:hypothetical protein
VYTAFWSGYLRERDHLEDTCARYEDDIKMEIEEVGWGSIDYIDYAQDTKMWRAVVNAVMNLRVPLNTKRFLIN